MKLNKFKIIQGTCIVIFSPSIYSVHLTILNCVNLVINWLFTSGVLLAVYA
jgi:hypothetical protein